MNIPFVIYLFSSWETFCYFQFGAILNKTTKDILVQVSFRISRPNSNIRDGKISPSSITRNSWTLASVSENPTQFRLSLSRNSIKSYRRKVLPYRTIPLLPTSDPSHKSSLLPMLLTDLLTFDWFATEDHRTQRNTYANQSVTENAKGYESTARGREAKGKSLNKGASSWWTRGPTWWHIEANAETLWKQTHTNGCPLGFLWRLHCKVVTA